MKKIFIFLLIPFVLIGAEVLKHDHIGFWPADGRYFDLVEFNGHTYVLYQNYGSKSDIMIHDPGCVCNNVR